MRVLYVCTGNSFRSPVAEALTRRFHPEMEVESAGTAPADHVAENAVALLDADDAARYVKPAPDPITRRALDAADRIIAMAPLHRRHLVDNWGVAADQVTVWGVPDPITPAATPEEAYDLLRAHVRAL